MALLAAAALALVVMVISMVMVAPPPQAQAAESAPSVPSPSTTGRQEGTTADAAKARGAGGKVSVPKLGKASNPYDMDALRSFDALSHR
jgi:hypothetical protein